MASSSSDPGPHEPRDQRGEDASRTPVLVGFDGSHDAATAIRIAARLMPARHARVAHLWSTPHTGSALYRRLAHRAWTNEHLERLVRREAAASAKNVAAGGVELAEAAGWTAEPFVRGVYGNEGLELAALAEELRPAAVVVGARGVGGLRGLLGSVSGVVVNRAPVPVLVVPPLLAEERAGVVSGPVLIAHDGSEGADRARAAATDLFSRRVHVVAHVDTTGLLGSHTSDAERGRDCRSEETGIPDEALMVPAKGFGPRAVADALAEEAAAQGAAALVLGSRGRSLMREVLLGSTARAALHQGHRPVLIVPPQTADMPAAEGSTDR
jgi:nucleotide-binding universal stress UspA family protein